MLTLRRTWKDIVAVGSLAGVVLALAGVQIPLIAERIQSELFAPDLAPAEDASTSRGAVMPALETPIAPASTEAGLPIQASVWLAPMASLGTSTGLGWVESTEAAPGSEDAQRRGFHVRLGGGLMAPLTPSVGVDIRG